MNRESLVSLKFWCGEREGIISFFVVSLAVALFYGAANLSKAQRYVSGVAEAHVLDSNLAGNQPKLAVKLESGSLAYLNIHSVGSIKVGSDVCLIKNYTYLGTINFKLRSTGKCT
ncbi:hypothetical protein EDC56_1072 [Sinobacterium caligoides]|uniref:Uncharacterized protein n=1 Tax=Sinobacterium caligoides TaxID=933926 RepID=A0A3N2E0I5_9GAMM|nr:hypothetical protein [Sinobacterium caligoides]ROS05537.1 hypothetical protein EDC56_1072 [Sinobacterium caligoides]